MRPIKSHRPCSQLPIESPKLTGDKRVDFAIWDLVQVIFEIAQTASAKAEQETDHPKADVADADSISH